MKKLLPILAFLFIAESSYAQNWNPLNPGVKRYYINANNYLKGMRIDSVSAAGNDLHYYPFKSRRMSTYGGLYWDTSSIHGCWLGVEVIKKTDGRYLFTNYWDDTAVIQSQAQVGESWVFYHDNSSIHYNATLIATDTMTLLGGLDSIKRIILTAFDNGNPILTDSFNNAEIVLSKNHGFYQVIDLYLFPYHAPDTNGLVDDYYFVNSLHGINVMNSSSIQNGTMPGLNNSVFKLINYPSTSDAELNNWSVGDIYEYSQCDFAPGTSSGCSMPFTYQLDTVVSKTITNAGVEYITHGWKATLQYTQNINDLYYSLVPFSDTVFFFNADSAVSASIMMPEEFDMIYNITMPLSHYYPADTHYCYPGDLYYSYGYRLGLGGGSSYCISKKGVGLIHRNSLSMDTGPEVNDRKLEYFVHNGIPCGTFILPDTSTTPVSVVSVNGNMPVNVYPNPANEQVTVGTSLQAYGLSLINTVGQVIYAKQHCSGKETIDVRNLASGVYYLKLESADGTVVNKKIIIQN